MYFSAHANPAMQAQEPESGMPSVTSTSILWSVPSAVASLSPLSRSGVLRPAMLELTSIRKRSRCCPSATSFVSPGSGSEPDSVGLVM